MPEPTELRYGELARGVLALLDQAPDGLAVQDVFDRIVASVPPTPFELEESPKSLGVRRYEEAVRRSTIALVRAGWLTKSADVWRVTEKGQLALSRFRDPLAFYGAAVRRRELDLTETAAPSDVGDIFAGCFLSLAGSLVGSVVGTVVLIVRMFPDVRIPELILGFVAGFVGGVIVGAIATFAAAPVARLIGGSRAENIWIGAVGTAAAIGAAVTAWLVIPV